jgi:opacity protein-like surface antigen
VATRALAASLVALWWLLRASPAGAYERQWHAGAGVGLMTFGIGSFSGPSVGLEGSLVYGLTDQFNALLEVTLSPHNLVGPAPDPCPEAPASCEPRRYAHEVMVLTGTTGLAYTLDVARWSPYAGALVGGMRASAGDGNVGALRGVNGEIRRFDLVFAGGLDFQATERWALGLALRFHAAPPGGENQLSTASLRVQYTWEQ